MFVFSNTLVGICFLFVALRFDVVSGLVTIRGWTSADVNVIESKDITLSCDASCSNKTCTYSWSPGSSSSSKLVLKKVNRNRPRIYTCTVKDPGDNNKKTCIWNLNILYPPDTLTITEKDNKFTCTASGGNPENYTFERWEHIVNGDKIRELEGEPSLRNSVLKLNSTYQDYGDYTCTVRNDNGKQNELLQMSLRKTYRPQVVPKVLTPTPIPEKQNISKGDTFSMSITIFSATTTLKTPRLIKHNGSSISSRSTSYIRYKMNIRVDVNVYGTPVRLTGKDIQWTINNMREDDFGEYTIVVENEYGQSNITTTIVPQGPPDIPRDFRVKVTSHDSIVFGLKSGFYNGANQTLVIQYREDFNGSAWMNGSTLGVGSAQDVEMRVTGLKPESLYVFSAYSYNIYSRSVDSTLNSIWTADEPANIALIAGVSGGTITFLVVIVILIIVVRYKRKSGKKSTARTLPKLPMNNILASGPQSEEEFPGTPVYENSELKTLQNASTNNDIYENTILDTKRPKVKNSVANQDNNYANLPILTVASSFNSSDKTSSPDTPIYSNTNVMMGIKDAHSEVDSDDNKGDVQITGGKNYANLRVEVTEEQEDDYLEMDVSSAPMPSPKPPSYKHSPKPTSSKRSPKPTSFKYSPKPSVFKYSTKDSSRNQPDEDYLDMEVKSPPKSPKPTGSKYGVKNYKNGSNQLHDNNISKGKSSAKSKNTKPVEEEEPSETYMDMEVGERESMAVPDFHAPPPPTAHQPQPGEGYVNLRKNGKSIF